MMASWSRFTAAAWLLASSSIAVGALRTTDSSSSVLQRKLEDGYDYSEFEQDLSQFSLRFEKCQYVRMFDDDIAEDKDSTSPLATRSFVAFRLCESDACSTCDSVYGKYVVDVETYLESTMQNQAQALATMCENCQDRCNTDDDGSCSDCGRTCYQYENFEAEGYVDAADYMECQQLENDNNNNGYALYVGPRCNSNGNQIVIGLFSDDECVEPVSDVDVEDALGAKLSYHLLAHTYSTDKHLCLSCMEDNDNDDNQGDQQDADDVNEMCEDIYNAAAKCESQTGLEYGFIQTSKEENQYENQVENEDMACTFIDSLLWNSYTETGEIDITSAQDVYIRHVTQNQALVLSALLVTVSGLVFAMKYFNKKIEQLGPSVSLSLRGDPSMT